ncbi:MAG: rRNA maturation RNase YbeY [Pseudomonadota bacterium]
MTTLEPDTGKGPLLIDIAIEAEGWLAVPDLPDPARLVETAIGHAAHAVVESLPQYAEVSVLLADDAAVQALNARWRGQDKPTNVLSFAANDADAPQSPLLGDIVLALETVLREARAQNKTASHHLAHLSVHGFLHLLGHDHLNDEEAETMEAKERAILADLGIADPYAAS